MRNIASACLCDLNGSADGESHKTGFPFFFRGSRVGLDIFRGLVYLILCMDQWVIFASLSSRFASVTCIFVCERNRERDYCTQVVCECLYNFNISSIDSKIRGRAICMLVSLRFLDPPKTLVVCIRRSKQTGALPESTKLPICSSRGPLNALP